MKYKCVICGKEIDNSHVSRKTCAKVACRKKYKAFTNTLCKQIKQKFGRPIILFGEPRRNAKRLSCFEEEVNKVIQNKLEEEKAK